MSTPRCPNHPDVSLLQMKRGWYCEECGRNVRGLERAVAGGLADVCGRLPSVIAVPALQALGESHPVLRLHRICDTVEVTARLLTIIALSARREIAPEPELARLLAQRMERPTLGVWVELVRLAVRPIEGREDTLGEIARFASQMVVELFRKQQPAPPVAPQDEPIRTLLDLRNILVHGGPMNRAAGERLAALWGPRFEAMLRSAEPLARSDLVYANAGLALHLVGPTATPRVYAAEGSTADALAQFQDRVTLVADGQVTDLWPLCMRDRAGAGGDAVYFRADRGALLFSVVHGQHSVIRSEGAWSEFRRLFPKRRDELAPTTFDTEFLRESNALVGRRAEVAAVKAALRHHEGCVVRLHGPGGIGKSFVAARVAVDLRGDPRQRLCVAWRFRRGDARSSRGSFLRHAVLQLARQSNAPDQLTTGDERALEARLTQLACRLTEAGRQLVFVLDGVDEIAALDPDLLEVPFRLAMPGVTWLCVGRAEEPVLRALDREDCPEAIPGGLPPMSTDEIRALLLEQPGEVKYGLLAHDSESSNVVANHFVAEVVERAAGLPLFVRFLLDDLLAGRADFADPATLPTGLSAYYERLLHGLALSDLQSLVTPAVVTLAVARAPLDLDALYELLVIGRRLNSGNTGRAALERALGSVSALLGAAPTPWGTPGFILTHETLGAHVCGSDDLANERMLTRSLLADLASAPARLASSGALARYLEDAGPAHLLDEGREEDFLVACNRADTRRACAAALTEGLRRQEAPGWMESLPARRDPRLVPAWIEACEAALALGRVRRVDACVHRLDPLPEPVGDGWRLRHERLVASTLRLRGDLGAALVRFARIEPRADSVWADRVRFEHAQALRESGRYVQATDMFVDLVQGSGRPATPRADRFLFTKQLADVLYVQGNLCQATTLLDRLAAESEGLDRERAEVLRIRGHVLRMAELLVEAAAAYREAGTLFNQADDIFGLARIETNLAETYARVDPRRALRHCALATGRNERLGVRIEVGKALNARGQAHQALGDLAAARDDFDRAAALQGATGYLSGVAMVDINRMHLLLQQGDTAAARSLYLNTRRDLRRLHAYPLLAARGALLLRGAGLRDRTMRRALTMARDAVEWPRGFADFERRVQLHYLE